MRRAGVVLWLSACSVAFAVGAWNPQTRSRPTAPEATLEEALGHRNPLVRSYELSRFFRDLDEGGIPDVLGTVEAASHWFDQQEHHLLMAAWIPLDPLAAVDWAFSRPGTLELRASVAVVEELGFHDPALAQSVVTSIEPEETREALHLHMVRGRARSTRKDELTEYLSELEPSFGRQHAIELLVNEILKDGPDAAVAWVDEVLASADDGFKRIAFQKTAKAIAHVEPAWAAQWIAGHRGRAYAARATRVVAEEWADRDPDSAMDWMISLPAGSERAQLVELRFKRWLRRDGRSAEAWARSAVPARGADPAVRVLVRRHFARQPALAMEWANRLQDPIVRRGVLISVGRSWLLEDRDALVAWLPESGLESGIRDGILNDPPAPSGRRPGPPDEAFQP